MLNPILPYCIHCEGNHLYQDHICDAFAFSPGKWVSASITFVHNENLYATRIRILLIENQNIGLSTEKSEVFHLKLLLQCFRKALIMYISPSCFPCKPGSFWITLHKTRHILLFRRHKDRDSLEGPPHGAPQEAQARCKPRAQHYISIIQKFKFKSPQDMRSVSKWKTSLFLLIFENIPKTTKKTPNTKSFNLNLQKSFLRKTIHNLVRTQLDAEVFP